jgi:basic membrane protein A
MNFVTIDGYSEGNANLKPVAYNMAESSYLAGYAAAAYSTSKVVGTYGGLQIPAVTDFMDGFYYGAMAWGDENDVPVTVVGWDPMAQTGQFIGDFVPNSGTSKSIAAALINEGADVLFPVGGDQFGASSEAIKEAGIDGVMIGVDKDVALTSPEYAPFVLTSAEKRMTNAVYDIIAELSAGGAFDGEAYVGTLANGGTGLSPFYDFDSKLSDEVKARLVEIEAGINSGEINPKS